MYTKLNINEITPRSELDVHRKLFELAMEEHGEKDPGALFEGKEPTKEDLIKEFSPQQPEILRRWSLWLQDEIIGFAFSIQNNPGVGEVNFNEGEAFINIFISKQHRRKGYGSEALRYLIRVLRKSGIRLLFTNTKLEGSKKFLEENGFDVHQSVMKENRLYLKELNRATLGEYLMVQVPSEFDVKTVECRELLDNVDPRQYCEVYNYLANNTTIETDDNHISEVTPEGVERKIEKHKAQNIDWYTTMLTNRNNEIVGLTEITISNSTSPLAMQNLTGILPEYRGNGFSKRLKAELLKIIISKHSQVEYIKTSTNVTNTGMNHINRKLGFMVNDLPNYIGVMTLGE